MALSDISNAAGQAQDSIHSAADQGLSQITDGKSYIDNLASRYVIKPKFAKGIGGFVFDYEGETRLRNEAEATDHYAEDNTAIQDHIAIKPLRITFRGFVAELATSTATGLIGAIQTIQNKLNVVPAYLGHYTPQALNTVNAALTQAQSVTNQINQGISKAKNIIGLLGRGAPGKTKQELAYARLKALGFPDPRVATQIPQLTNFPHIFVVQTPYGIFDNMMIESLEMIQDETTKFWSDITITVKQMRFAETISIPNVFSNFEGRRATQNMVETDKGTASGQKTDASILSSTSNFIFGK